mmetsp:Transcript_93805/g.268534  ORF Transcript_93805/g.268534 Transcript_93805/m.268534 type:complete len:201 (+) Transcript_93805:589-1191(+)
MNNQTVVLGACVEDDSSDGRRDGGGSAAPRSGRTAAVRRGPARPCHRWGGILPAVAGCDRCVLSESALPRVWRHGAPRRGPRAAHGGLAVEPGAVQPGAGGPAEDRQIDDRARLLVRLLDARLYARRSHSQARERDEVRDHSDADWPPADAMDGQVPPPPVARRGVGLPGRRASDMGRTDSGGCQSGNPAAPGHIALLPP